MCVGKNVPFRNRHFFLCFWGYRVEFSVKQSDDFLRYLYVLLLQFLDVLDQLQDARRLRTCDGGMGGAVRKICRHLSDFYTNLSSYTIPNVKGRYLQL